MKPSKEQTLLIVAVGVFTIFNIYHSITSKSVSAQITPVNTLPTQETSHSSSTSEDKNISDISEPAKIEVGEEENAEAFIESNSDKKDNENSKEDENEIEPGIEETKPEPTETEPREEILISAVTNSDQDQNTTSPSAKEPTTPKQTSQTEAKLESEENEVVPEPTQEPEFKEENPELELDEEINLDLEEMNETKAEVALKTKLQTPLEILETTEEKITKAHRDLILDTHNNERAKLDLAPLSWSTELSKSAQDWADTLSENDCKITHSTSTYGENIYYGWNSIELVLNPATVVNKWIDEKKFYNYQENTCAKGEQCGHYTQVVWKNTEKVGCGVSTCVTPEKKEQVWVCQYDPAGNKRNEKPY